MLMKSANGWSSNCANRSSFGMAHRAFVAGFP